MPRISFGVYDQRRQLWHGTSKHIAGVCREFPDLSVEVHLDCALTEARARAIAFASLDCQRFARKVIRRLRKNYLVGVIPGICIGTEQNQVEFNLDASG